MESGKAGAAPATVDEFKQTNMPLRISVGRRSARREPLMSPETGLLCVDQGVARGDIEFQFERVSRNMA